MLVRTIYLDDVKPISLNETHRTVSAKERAHFKKRKGKKNTDKYNDWIKKVKLKMQLQNRTSIPVVSGYFGLAIKFDRRLTKADIDNLCKPLIDCLVKSNIVPDDRKLEKVCIQKTTDAGIYIEIYDMNNSAQEQEREVKNAKLSRNFQKS